MQSILSTVAGPEEKKRAKSLFEHVEVVNDKLTERAAKLKISDKISPRSKVSRFVRSSNSVLRLSNLIRFIRLFYRFVHNLIPH